MNSTLDKILLADYVEETGLTYKEIYEISKGLKYAEETNKNTKTKKDTATKEKVTR